MTSGPKTATDELLYDGHDLEALSELGNYQRWIASMFIPYLGSHAVEFGAGIGAISQWLVPEVERMDLVEPSPNLIDRLGERFAHETRVKIISDSLENYVEAQPEGCLDSAVLVNLLEHIEDDAGAVGLIKKILRPGGYLLVFVPALPFLYSSMDKRLGHHRRYTRNSLAAVARCAGLGIVTLRYFDIFGVLPWWLVNTLGQKEKFDVGMARLYDRVAVPLARRIESMIAPPVGKNLLMIARRPGP